MSRSRCTLALLALLTVPALVQADTLDPYIRIGDPGTGTPVGTAFTFGTNNNGGGFLRFYNATEVTFSSLNFQVNLPAGDTITCNPTPFYATCSFSSAPPSNGIATFNIGFKVGEELSGIHPGVSFSINLNDLIDGQENQDPNGAGSWGPDNDFRAFANGASPEPATWGFLALGTSVLGLAALRRRAAR